MFSLPEFSEITTAEDEDGDSENNDLDSNFEKKILSLMKHYNRT